MKRIIALPKPALAILLCCAMAACTAAQIAQYITLIGQFAANALSLVAAFQSETVSASDLAVLQKFENLAQKANTDIQAGYQAYEADHAQGQPVLIAALQAAETEMPAFLADAQISNTNLQTRIEAVTTAILMSAESIAAFFPNAAPPTTTTAVRLKSGRVYQLPARVKTSPSDIKKFWNNNVCPGIASGCSL